MYKHIHIPDQRRLPSYTMLYRRKWKIIQEKAGRRTQKRVAEVCQQYEFYGDRWVSESAVGQTWNMSFSLLQDRSKVYWYLTVLTTYYYPQPQSNICTAWPEKSRQSAKLLCSWLHLILRLPNFTL